MFHLNRIRKSPLSKALLQSGSILLLLLIAACGTSESSDETSTESGGKAPDKPKEPITMHIHAAGVSPEEFDRRFRQVLKSKFPHITIEYSTNTKGNAIGDLVVSGNIPDIVRIDIPSLHSGYLDLGLGFDLKPFISKYNYNIARFSPAFIQELESVTSDGKLYGLPVPPFFPNVLYYNKDLFDKFGVPYPQNGLNWDQVYELAQKLTRVEGGTTYHGISMNLRGMLRDNTFSLPILDPEKDGLANPAQWQTLFGNLKRFYDIPNNKFESVSAESNLFGQGLSAMSANLHSVYLNIPTGINWDIVSLPTLVGAPKRVSQRGPAYWAVTNTSKHKEEAFEAIMEMLSDEVQLNDSKQGIPATITSRAIQEVLGQEHEVYKNKNMNAVTFYPPSDPAPKRKPGLAVLNQSVQETVILAAFSDYALGLKDLNTVLREADEALAIKVAEERAKQGKK